MENSVSSSLLVIGAPPCTFSYLGYGSSNPLSLASWGQDLTLGAVIVICSSPLSQAFFSYFLNLFGW